MDIVLGQVNTVLLKTENRTTEKSTNTSSVTHKKPINICFETGYRLGIPELLLPRSEVVPWQFSRTGTRSWWRATGNCLPSLRRHVAPRDGILNIQIRFVYRWILAAENVDNKTQKRWIQFVNSVWPSSWTNHTLFQCKSMNLYVLCWIWRIFLL